ncbi:SsrA-binding protein [Kribbella flavida DSM 17836]|uniref:SsrA-binding protein n=1 Tax=Kribbella flavida (strain DSM 17836 / JCM 10339 / NBRC 14399) TaxID=479435 RepID=D2PNI4_KRIFD|nr:SsrA-binding protein SmpB [Kribbella flavida]ADB30836.1 SsrA-binding protein [Kribbella flavida DSM 17836]
MVKQTGQKPIAQNRKARHDYHIDDVVEAGLVLTGTEVKSLRLGRASLVDAFASVRGNELWLQNMHIPEYTHGTWTNHEPRRTRKLLLHRDEMQKLIKAIEQQGVTLVPLSLYFKDGYAKVELATARGKKDYDKRHALAERQASREAQRALSERHRR